MECSNRRTLVAIALTAVTAVATSQTIDPYYSGSYTHVSLGSVPGVPTNYGGLTLLYNDPNKLIIGGSANGANGNLYVIDVIRDANNHITGFSGTAQVYAAAPYNDGGVVFGPSNVLFASRWPVNELAQYKPGSTSPDKVINLAALGVAGSNSALNFVPTGFNGAGRVKLVSYSGGQFYDATLSPDGSGTFDLVGLTQVATLPGGPEGFAYVPQGSPVFTAQSMILSEYAAGSIATYELDANGNPIVGSRRTFMTGLSGAEGAFIDPMTGDFLFSTFGGGNQVVRVTGFAIPEPGTIAALGLGLAALLRRRKNA